MTDGIRELAVKIADALMLGATRIALQHSPDGKIENEKYQGGRNYSNVIDTIEQVLAQSAVEVWAGKP